MILAVAAALAFDADGLEVDDAMTTTTWRALGGADLAAAGRACAAPWVPLPDQVVKCVRIDEVVAVLNARSAADGLAPAYAIEGDVIRFDPEATGWRLPTCGEARRLFGVEDPDGGRDARLRTGGTTAWCVHQPRRTPLRVPIVDAPWLSRWRSATTENGEVRARVEGTTPIGRRHDTVIPVRGGMRAPTADAPETRTGPIPPGGGWLHPLGGREVLIAGFELDAATWAALGGPAWTVVDGRCTPGVGPGELPARCVSPREAAVVLNAMSARDGLTPAYRIGARAVELDASADGWRLPVDDELDVLVPPDVGPCPVGANLGGDLPEEARVPAPIAWERCAPDGAEGIAPARDDDGRFGNVAELALTDGQATRFGPSWTSAQVFPQRAVIGLDDRAPDLGLRPERTVSGAAPWRVHTRAMVVALGVTLVAAGLLVGLLARRWPRAATVAGLLAGAVGVGGGVAIAASLRAAPPPYVLVDLPVRAFDFVSRHDVVGDDAAALDAIAWRAECRPKLYPYRPHACAPWRVTWEAVGVPSADSCAADVTVDLWTGLRLPRAWIPADDPALALAWRDWLADLYAHEEGHRLAGVRAAEAIMVEIRGLPPQPTCEAAIAAADARAQELLAEAHRKDDAFQARGVLPADLPPDDGAPRWPRKKRARRAK